MRKLMIGLLAAALVPASANAAAFTNGSFETGPAAGSFTTLGNGSTAISGWTVMGQSIDYIGSYWQAADGSHSIDLNGSGQGGISQTFDTVSGRMYNVSFMLAGNPDGAPQGKTIVVLGTPGGSSQFSTFPGGSVRPSPMNWTSYTYSFLATSKSSTLSFMSQDAGVYGAALDDVVVTAVPEPATWALMIGGFGLIGGAMRRRSASLRSSIA